VFAEDLDGLVSLQRLLTRHGLDVHEFDARPFGSGAAVRLVLRSREEEAHRLVADLREVPALRFVTDDQLEDPDG
jgi:hypothetical protein